MSAQDGAAYTMNSRDYKGVMIVVLSEDIESLDATRDADCR
jgi:hypothetical protein